MPLAADRVVAGLAKVGDDGAEARRLNCTHVIVGEAAKEISAK